MSGNRIANRIPQASADEAIFAEYKTAPRYLSNAAIARIEQNLTSGSAATNRRYALASLAKSGAEMIALAGKDKETAVVIASVGECARLAAESLRQAAEILEAASLRVTLALCTREDMQAIVDEARAGFEAQPSIH